MKLIKYIIYSNPSNGVFNLKLNADSNNIKIYDIHGKLIMFKELNKGLHEINFSDAGFYFLEINNQNYVPILIKN